MGINPASSLLYPPFTDTFCSCLCCFKKQTLDLQLKNQRQCIPLCAPTSVSAFRYARLVLAPKD